MSWYSIEILSLYPSIRLLANEWMNEWNSISLLIDWHVVRCLFCLLYYVLARHVLLCRSIPFRFARQTTTPPTHPFHNLYSYGTIAVLLQLLLLVPRSIRWSREREKNKNNDKHKREREKDVWCVHSYALCCALCYLQLGGFRGMQLMAGLL